MEKNIIFAMIKYFVWLIIIILILQLHSIFFITYFKILYTKWKKKNVKLILIKKIDNAQPKTDFQKWLKNI